MVNCHVGISDINVYVPKERMSIEHITNLSGLNKEELTHQLGIAEKPILEDCQSIISMGILASKKLLLTKDIASETIDIIIFCSCGIYDKYFWSPAAAIQNEINAVNAHAFDISCGCNASNVGLNIAKQLLLSDSSKNNALIVVCDAISKIVRHADKKHKRFFSFSDAAAAIFIKKGEINNIILGFEAYTKSEFANCFHVSREDWKIHINDVNFDWQQLSSAYREMYPKIIKKTAEKYGIKLKDIKHIFMNQGDHRLMQEISDQLNISRDIIFESYKTHGHMAGADVFYGLNKLLKAKKINKGDLIVLATSGIGFTWAVTLLQA